MLIMNPIRIRVSFSIADLDNIDQDADQDADQYADDKAQYDEDESDLTDAQSGGAQSKGTINQGRTKDGNFNIIPEDRVAPADRPELADDEPASDDEVPEPGFPARVNVTIDKGGKGVLQVETTVQDGDVMIEHISYFSKPELADAQTAELDWSKRNLYTGPPFGNLDQDLQLLLERYLDERGVNTELALWIPEYIDFKEQREYLHWLSSKFIMRVVVAKFSQTNCGRRREILCRCVKQLRHSVIAFCALEIVSTLGGCHRSFSCTLLKILEVQVDVIIAVIYRWFHTGPGPWAFENFLL